MSNEDTSPETGVTPTPGPATGPTASTGATPEKPTATSEETLARIAELERALKNATEERDRHRKKLSGYEDAERKAQEAQLSEIERVNKQYSELQAQHTAYAQSMQERVVRYEIERQAAKLGIIDPDAAAKLLDRSALEYDEDGTPHNAAKLLKKLIEDKPYLAPAPSQPEQQAPTRTQPVRPPALPAMQPGRSNIPAPGATPPGRIPRLSDPGVLVPPGTVAKYQP